MQRFLLNALCVLSVLPMLAGDRLSYEEQSNIAEDEEQATWNEHAATSHEEQATLQKDAGSSHDGQAKLEDDVEALTGFPSKVVITTFLKRQFPESCRGETVVDQQLGRFHGAMQRVHDAIHATNEDPSKVTLNIERLWKRAIVKYRALLQLDPPPPRDTTPGKVASIVSAISAAMATWRPPPPPGRDRTEWNMQTHEGAHGIYEMMESLKNDGYAEIVQAMFLAQSPDPNEGITGDTNTNDLKTDRFWTVAEAASSVVMLCLDNFPACFGT